MANFKASIPGWLDALKLEAEQHDDSFVNPYDDICGVPVRHLSLADATTLRRIGNRLFSGNFPSYIEFCALPELREHAIAFLLYQHVKPSTNTFICMYRRFKFGRRFSSVEYSISEYRIIRFIKRYWFGEIQPSHFRDEIINFLNATYLDSLGTTSGAKSGESLWSNLVGYIDLIASEYGWTDEYILNMPYRKLIQLVRRISSRKDPDFIVSPASDRIVSRHNAGKNRKK